MFKETIGDPVIRAHLQVTCILSFSANLFIPLEKLEKKFNCCFSMNSAPPFLPYNFVSVIFNRKSVQENSFPPSLRYQHRSSRRSVQN